ncbi:nicotinate-nucleotide--dimethylbenzimidazole phosphoribosyltransferase [Vibrio ezurae]|uniref:Nicotinate-nucleotide--dimethylbenzimidazole phosphoribosyltransferase n=1 Tax=Vibrio ezurae NBRC 102218 TaxID=1219080 RepID=U3B679_9VIBR|nr:nicotinate-nucleotide--dimethylbenzimidazole phosphoribosyltransferase [Vibrio ezurae]GAD80927.1 nicotinate-nucleotide--dimethylbenzimidazole phosphoribosyltransferase [Vibrio ezurae NBRC 102218]
MFSVDPVNHTLDEQIRHIIDQKTKPLGALGQLEALAAQIARVQATGTDSLSRLTITKPAMLVFAADHGIAEYGVSIAPSAVTTQMVYNFVAGGAAINVFSRQTGFNLEVIDCGILEPLADPTGVTQQRLGTGTAPIHKAPAMSLEQVEQGFSYANELIQRHQQSGCNLIALGEMGIGNTSSATAIMSALLNVEVSQCVGRGTGIDDDALQLKTTLLNQAIELHRDQLTSPKQILAHLGGFEIVQMTGAILAAAQRKMLVVIDGFIATAAALVAVELHPEARDYLIFAHQSNESGHKLMLKHLEATPLLHLDLRLGEGTGGALALPLIQAATNFYNDMASFGDAGVSNVT